MRVLVTGATGFVGRHLVTRLVAEGHSVVAYVRNPDKFKGLEGVTLVVGDLFNKKALALACKDVDVVFHLAAMIHAIRATEQDYRRVNALGTKNVLDACGRLKRFVYVSSVTVYGSVDSPRTTVIDESYPCIGQNEYGKTKYEGEIVVQKSGQPYTIVRPGRVYGPGDLTLLPLSKLIRKRLFLQVGGGKSLMMPIYIDDLIDFLILSLKKKALGETYIAVGDACIPKKRLMESLAKELGVSLRRFSVHPWLAFTAAFLIEMPFRLIRREPLVSRKQLRFFVSSRRYSIAKAQKDLGFKPRVSLEKGVQALISWYKAEGLL